MQVAAQVPHGTEPGAFDADSVRPKGDRKRTTLAVEYALAAAKEALLDSEWDPSTDEERFETGVAIGQGFAGLSDIKEACDLMEKGKARRISPYFIPRILTNTAGGYVGLTHGLWGPCHSAATACATGSHAVGDAYRMIQHGNATVMLAGGTEAAIDPVAMAGFCQLKALSTNFNDPVEASRASRPFDGARDGFVMGEGSAVLVLEEREHALKRGARIYAEVSGYGLGGDGYHMTAPAPDGRGAKRAMEMACRAAGLLGRDLSYINAHATSTPLGDAIELDAITNVTAEGSGEAPWISSVKGSVGHLLGAAGALEALVCVAAIRDQVVPPSINIETPPVIVQGGPRLAMNDAIEVQITSAMSNSFGFGGPCASLVFTQHSC